MILFWSIAAAFTAAALLFLLPPLLRNRTTAPDAHVAANAAIYREQLAELGADLQRGAVTREEFERSSREIERRIVSEHGLPAAPQPAGWRPNTAVAVALGLLVPLAVVLGYRQLGEPRALNPESAQASAQQMEALVQRLSAHLQQTPQDADGWTLLARALASLGRYDPAAQAYARALQLLPDNRDLLVEFIKTLALAGSAEFDGKNYAGAIGYWERILPFAPPQSEFARTVSASIAEARQLGGIAAPAGASLQGVVSLAPALKGKVSPGDTVFVLARPVTRVRKCRWRWCGSPPTNCLTRSRSTTAWRWRPTRSSPARPGSPSSRASRSPATPCRRKATSRARARPWRPAHPA